MRIHGSMQPFLEAYTTKGALSAVDGWFGRCAWRTPNARHVCAELAELPIGQVLRASATLGCACYLSTVTRRIS